MRAGIGGESPWLTTVMAMSKSHTALGLLHVHAHPDDDSSKDAATTAYCCSRGVGVMVATCTGGERGDILNAKLASPENEARLPELRRAEMAETARILDIEQAWLGFIVRRLLRGAHDALRAHATQIDPDGPWFAVPLEIQQSAHPSEDYQLVRT